MSDPVQILAGWLDDARKAEQPAPTAMTLVTVSPEGRPSARVVTLKRLEADGLVFTTALWTRKVEELRANPHVAAVFHWPAIGRQVRVEGRAEIAEPELADELFADRPPARRLQALVSRQGEQIDDLAPLRDRLEARREEMRNGPIPRPDDWGAVRIRPLAIEFWQEAADRLHDRLAYEAGEDGWRCRRLAP